LGHAQALIEYSEHDPLLAESLAYHVQARRWQAHTTPAETIASPHTVPTNDIAALTQARWLLATLDEHRHATHTRGALATWASEYQSPEDIIIGIVGIAIMGPTLGILERKKKTKSYLQVVLDATWAKGRTAAALTEQVQRLSQQVIARELRLAGGNAYRMHPDTAAWCLEEPLTKVHLASGLELAALTEAATAEGLSCAIKPGVGVALSPTVKETFVGEFNVSALE
ncbi:hypothetical protein KC906_01675, partial [Candidatus Kaiserbacteria bacterium]|nr:hypothetical protein [Candidatus Kaiserbacteria bacterium]